MLVLGLTGGCAKFPANGANANYTAITFSMTVARQINSAYLYYVAIRSSVPVSPSPDGMPPTPVKNVSQSSNGFVAGSPTQFVLFNPNHFNTPFVLYQFETREQQPNPSDPTNPINLTLFNISNIGVITNYTPPNPGTSDQPNGSPTLSFTVYANLIPDTLQPAPTAKNPNSQIPNVMQVQFLTMNSNRNIPNRVIDYVGSDGTAQYLQVDLRNPGNYNNDPGNIFAGVLQVNCPDPDLDLTDFGISVQPP